MPERVRGDPRLPDAEARAVPGEQLAEGLVAQRLTPLRASAADEEHEGAVGVGGAFPHHIGAHGGEGFRLVQIDHALLARLGADPFGVVDAITHGDAAPPVLDVVEVQGEDFAGAQPALQHQQDHRAVPLAMQRRQEWGNVRLVEGARQALNGLDLDLPSNRPLPARASHHRPVPLRDARGRRVVHHPDGILAIPEATGHDQVFIERGHRGKDAIDGRGREPPCRVPVGDRHQHGGEPLGRCPVGHLA